MLYFQRLILTQNRNVLFFDVLIFCLEIRQLGQQLALYLIILSSVHHLLRIIQLVHSHCFGQIGDAAHRVACFPSPQAYCFFQILDSLALLRYLPQILLLPFLQSIISVLIYILFSIYKLLTLYLSSRTIISKSLLSSTFSCFLLFYWNLFIVHFSNLFYFLFYFLLNSSNLIFMFGLLISPGVLFTFLYQMYDFCVSITVEFRWWHESEVDRERVPYLLQGDKKDLMRGLEVAYSSLDFIQIFQEILN